MTDHNEESEAQLSEAVEAIQGSFQQVKQLRSQTAEAVEAYARALAAWETSHEEQHSADAIGRLAQKRRQAEREMNDAIEKEVRNLTEFLKSQGGSID